MFIHILDWISNNNNLLFVQNYSLQINKYSNIQYLHHIKCYFFVD